MKYITFMFSNGEKWGIPAEIIAKDRATYYADHDAKDAENYQEEYDRVYAEEFEYTMNEAFEAIDYLRNNIPFEIIEDRIIKLRDTRRKPMSEYFNEVMTTGEGIRLEEIE